MDLDHVAVSITHPYVELRDGDSVIPLHFLWLRDHCRCEECYNHVTFQRKRTLLDLADDEKVDYCCLQSGNLYVDWNDGHESTYPLKWLLDNTHETYVDQLQRHREPVLWDRFSVRKMDIPHVSYNDLMDTNKGEARRKVVHGIVKYGVAFVEDVEPTVEATESVVNSMFIVQRTLFGDMWCFSDSLDHSDTAYSKDGLGAHSDNTYFTEAAGLQVLHCLKHIGVGGETLLVDGFNVARQMAEQDPVRFERLVRTSTTSEYIEEGNHYTATGPIVRLNDVTKDVEQIRFNVYDRAPITLPESCISNYYADVKAWSRRIADPAVEWWFKLQPGTVMFFDNWRLLHGRSAYSGERHMAGCYVSRSDWLNSARVMGCVL